MIEVLDYLEDSGLIHQKKGIHFQNTSKFAKRTRIWATQKLGNIFQQFEQGATGGTITWEDFPATHLLRLFH